MPASLPLGWINYWNLWPLRVELKKSLIFSAASMKNRMEFFEGHPAQVNKGLVEGRIGLAPSSSICLLKHNALNFALPIGVASTGPVMSVYLGFPANQQHMYEVWRERTLIVRELFRQVYPEKPGDPRRSAADLVAAVDDLMKSGGISQEFSFGGEVRLTPASAASVVMTKVIHRLLFGTPLAARTGSEPAIDLLIGDEALKKRGCYSRILDLGEVWNLITGLPFVFAVWQFGASVTAVDAAAMRPVLTTIKECAERAQAKMKVAAADYCALLRDTVAGQGSENVDLAQYWRMIEYTLTPRHLRGLVLYLSLARATGAVLLADEDQAIRRLMQLFQQCEDASGRQVMLS